MRLSLWSQIEGELIPLLRRGYPRFVLSPHPRRMDYGIPVFVYHSIEPTFFEEQIHFLKENRYQSLCVNDFSRIMSGKTSPPAKAVLLTVDDGRSSFWRFGYPILRKYEMRATAFIIPGRIPEADACRWNLGDMWDHRTTREEVCGLDPLDQSLCNWKEIEEMFASGLINIESHTLFHREIFRNTRLVDMITPRTSFLPYNSPLSAYLTVDDVGKEIEHQAYYGLPVFTSAPLMRGVPALKINEDLMDFCRLQWSGTGGYEGREKKSTRMLSAALRKEGMLGSLERQKPEEVWDSLCEDIRVSRYLIQHRLGADAGNHLCFPHGEGSDLALRAARAVGMHSCFWGCVPGRPINKPGDDLNHVVRIKNDFIWRLPGKQRKDLLSVYRMKVLRRIGGKTGF